MKRYIGVKMINAAAMTRLAYNQLRGWDLPADEEGTDEGFLVEYLNGGQANHPDFKGYISWSPKAVFEQAYRPTDGMSFGLAIEAAKNGERVARVGWNGKGMWISYSPGHPELSIEQIWTPHIQEAALENGGSVCILPYFNMKTADGKIQCGWLASQSDMLAEDWMIV